MIKPNQIVPLNNRVLVEKLEDEVYKGVIIIPDAYKDSLKKDMIRGIVIKVGPGNRNPDNPKVRIPVAVKEGDVIYFTGRWNDWYLGPKEFALITENDIAGVANRR